MPVAGDGDRGETLQAIGDVGAIVGVEREPQPLQEQRDGLGEIVAGEREAGGVVEGDVAAEAIPGLDGQCASLRE